MRLIAMLAVLMCAVNGFGAVPSYTVFRGSGGISITTNPPTGLIVIDGSGVFSSSGTNATIATSTNGVLVAAASTNINFVTGTNMVIRATNTASSTHISFNTVIPLDAKTVAVAVNGTTVTLVATQINFVQGINTLVTGTNISGGYMHVGINLKPNLIFSAGANDMVLGTWGNVFGISNVASGDLMFYNPDPGAGNDVVFDGLISAVNANFSLLAGSGDFVSISPGGTLQRTNGATQSQLTTLSNVLVNLSSNVAPAPPISSVQFNSNGVQQGSADFLFTNGVAKVGQGVEVTTGSFVLNGGTTALVAWNGLGRIRWDADGVARFENDAALGFNRINLGGDTEAFPAIGRSAGDVVILGANGAFGFGASTNRLLVSGGIVLSNIFRVQQGAGTIGQVLAQADTLGTVMWTNAAVGGGSVAPPVASIQFNHASAFAGTNLFVFDRTNNRVGVGITTPLATMHLVNTGSIGLAQVRMENLGQTDNAWELALDSNPETTTFGIRRNGSYLITWETPGNVGIGTTNPANRLDVEGRMAIGAAYSGSSTAPTDGLIVVGNVGIATASPTNALDVNGNVGFRANVFLPVLPTNASPIAFLAVDGGGMVYETARPAGITSINEDTTANHTISLVTNLTRPFPGITNPLGFTEINIPWAAAAVSGALHSNDFKRFTTNALIQTNGVNVGSIGTLNWTAGITGSVSGTVVTLGASAAAGGFSVSGNSNQIPYLNQAGTAFTFGATNRNNPGFGFSKAPNQHNGALMIHEDETNVYSLVAIGHPTLGSSIPFFCPSLTISNRYAYSGSGDKVTQEVVRVTMVDIVDGTSPESFIQTWQHQDDTSAPTLAAGIRRDGQLIVAHGTMYPSNSLASTMPTAAQLGPGGYWVGNSNASLVTVYSLNGSTTAMKVLAP